MSFHILYLKVMDPYEQYMEELMKGIYFDNNVYKSDKIMNCNECGGFIILGSTQSRHSISCSFVPKCVHCMGRLDKGTLGHDIGCKLVPKCDHCGVRLDTVINHMNNCPSVPRCDECGGKLDSGISGHSKSCSQIIPCEECGFPPIKNLKHYYSCSKIIKCSECGCPSIMLKGHYSTCSMF